MKAGQKQLSKGRIANAESGRLTLFANIPFASSKTNKHLALYRFSLAKLSNSIEIPSATEALGSSVVHFSGFFAKEDRMDPNRAWLDLLEASREHDWEQAASLASDLKDWLTRDGFPPTVISQLPMALEEARTDCWLLQKELALRTCEYVLSVAQTER